MGPRFPVVAVEAAADRVEELCEALFELGAQGIEQRDAQTHPDPRERLPLRAPDRAAEAEAWPSLAVAWRDEGASGGQLSPMPQADSEPWGVGRGGLADGCGVVTLLASFATREQAERAIAGLADLAPSVRCQAAEIVGDEWRDRFRRCFQPFALTPSVTVVPPWLAQDSLRASARPRLLQLDPGRAFGTGLHASTALVAEILDERQHELRGQRLLDVGTGSGILALVAILLGASSALGIDEDPEALGVARANAARNGLGAELELCDTPVGALQEAFPWVVANIELGVLCAMAADLGRRTAPGGTLVLSGVLEPGLAQLCERFVGPGGVGFDLEQTRQRFAKGDRWMALILRRDRGGREP